MFTVSVEDQTLERQWLHVIDVRSGTMQNVLKIV